jgi:hypothetical protein
MKKVLLSILAALSLAACKTEPDEARYVSGAATDEGFTDIEVVVSSNTGRPSAVGPAVVESRIVALIDNAQTEVLVAAGDFESQRVADALVRAAARGVTVRVVGDVEDEQQPGFVALKLAGIDVVFGDGELFWTPNLDASIRRTDESNKMLHSMIVVDYIRTVILTAGFVDVTTLHTQVVLFAVYEEWGRDARQMIQQLLGGTFSTTLTQFDAALSSDTNNRTIYPSSNEPFEFYVGPGEPLLKHVIDEVYETRANVWVVSSVLDHEPFADALVYKARAGFDVRVVVSPESLDRPGEQVSRLQSEFADLAVDGQDWPSLVFSEDIDLTAVVIDTEISPLSGLQSAASAMVLTAPIHNSAGYRQTGPDNYVAQEADIFTDATMFVIQQTTTGQQPNLQRVRDLLLAMTMEGAQ